MKESFLSQSHFHNEEAAYIFVENILWPDGPVCPHCRSRERIGKMGGKSTRIGLYKCYACRKPFTVKIGTIFEDSHVRLNLWLQAIYLICASKKGCSANQIHRTLGVTLKTAWFMGHRIREAMKNDSILPFGGKGEIVESDETFIGNDPDKPKKRGYGHKHKVLSLVDRKTKQARSVVIEDLKASTIIPILEENITYRTRIMTDDAVHYDSLDEHFEDHQVVCHSKGEYVSKKNPSIHTNTVEGFFSIFKRGMKGVYQHCKKQHLHRYLAEFDFRYNNRVKNGYDDSMRAVQLIKGVAGKRLTYQTAHQ